MTPLSPPTGPIAPSFKVVLSIRLGAFQSKQYISAIRSTFVSHLTYMVSCLPIEVYEAIEGGARRNQGCKLRILSDCVYSVIFWILSLGYFVHIQLFKRTSNTTTNYVCSYCERLVMQICLSFSAYTLRLYPDLLRNTSLGPCCPNGWHYLGTVRHKHT